MRIRFEHGGSQGDASGAALSLEKHFLFEIRLSRTRRVARNVGRLPVFGLDKRCRANSNSQLSIVASVRLGRRRGFPAAEELESQVWVRLPSAYGDDGLVYTKRLLEDAKNVAIAAAWRQSTIGDPRAPASTACRTECPSTWPRARMRLFSSSKMETIAYPPPRTCAKCAMPWTNC